jgi:hypothetical protein
MNALGSCYEDYGLNTVFLIINSCGDPFLVLVEPTINIESLAVYLQLHWIDLLMIKLDILYIKKKRKGGLWFDYCLFPAGSVDWTADIPIVANSFAV